MLNMDDSGEITTILGNFPMVYIKLYKNIMMMVCSGLHFLSSPTVGSKPLKEFAVSSMFHDV